MEQYCKDKLDRQAEREGVALLKQGRYRSQQGTRRKLKEKHGVKAFDDLFKRK